MDQAWDDTERIRHVFEETRVIRKPLTGIIKGYHVLPYVLVGPEREEGRTALEIRGSIRVSPRLVLGGDGPTYGDVFGEREVLHRALIARIFSFRYAPRVQLQSDDLKIERQTRSPEDHLARVLDELSRREIVNTGVIVSPDARFYPVSLDRFIRELLDQEFHD